MSDVELERLIEEKGLSGADAAEIRAFSRFLQQVPAPREVGKQVFLVDHWALDYMNGGPSPALRWEGDDS